MRNHRVENSIRSVIDGLDSLPNGKNATQRQVAFAAGLDPAHISDMVLGKREPYVGTALRIAAALGCSVEDIFALVEKGRAA